MGSAAASEHCLTAVGQWAVKRFVLTAQGQWAGELLRNTASLPSGSGQWNSFCILPLCLRAVGSGIPSVHCLTAPGKWAVELLEFTATLPLGLVGNGTPPVLCVTALGAVGSGVPFVPCCIAPGTGDSGHWHSFCTLLHCLGQWALEFLLCAASLHWGNGNAMHAVRTQCKVLDVGKYSNPSFGPFSQASVEAVRFALQSTLPDR